jgi:hypothetical protein
LEEPFKIVLLSIGEENKKMLKKLNKYFWKDPSKISLPPKGSINRKMKRIGLKMRVYLKKIINTDK